MFREGFKYVKRSEPRGAELLDLIACRGDALEDVTYHPIRAHIFYSLQMRRIALRGLRIAVATGTLLMPRDAQACPPMAGSPPPSDWTTCHRQTRRAALCLTTHIINRRVSVEGSRQPSPCLLPFGGPSTSLREVCSVLGDIRPLPDRGCPGEFERRTWLGSSAAFVLAEIGRSQALEPRRQCGYAARIDRGTEVGQVGPLWAP
jgi:hypothetical protein